MILGLKRVMVIALDLIAINASLLIGFLLRFEGTIPNEYTSIWYKIALLVSISQLFFFITLGLYRSLWRYSSLPELIQIIKAVTLSTVVIWAVIFLFPFVRIPRSIGFITWSINILIISGVRLTYRLYREVLAHRQRIKTARKVLIIGAGSAGSMIVHAMKQKASADLCPIAFLDDDERKCKHSLHSIPIVGKIADLPMAVERYHPDEILISIPSASKERIREIVTLAEQTGLLVRTLPDITDLGTTIPTVNHIREVKIEDLLGREPVEVDLEAVAGYIRGERVLVTGAGGSIGSELCRQVARLAPEVLLILGRGENSIYEIDQELSFSYGMRLNKVPIITDIRDRKKTEMVFRQYHPTVVFHAAAHKHVPLMESAPDEAVKNNVFGTKNVAELADQFGVRRFVMISTDKAVRPTSVMGCTKRIAELIVLNLARASRTKFCTVRFGNVLGSRGSVIPLFKKQIARGGPITITHPEMRRFFMTIPEAVNLVIQAGAMGKGGEVFVLDMGKMVRIQDLACDLIRLCGLEPEKDIPIKYSGIRPGEKLYEELLTEEEGVNVTKHKRIFVSKSKEIDWDRLSQDLEELRNVTYSTMDYERVVQMLKRIVPRFTPDLLVKREITVGERERKMLIVKTSNG